MASELAAAYVTLTVDGSKVSGDVNKALQGSAGPAADRAGRDAGKRFSSGLRGTVAKGAGLFAGLFAADKAVEFFKGAIDGASDLNEAGTKINAIFGKSGAAAVQQFAAAGAQALGQTKLDVLDAASNFGTFGKAAGLAGKPLADFSTKFAGLSTDLASFYNTSPEQAVEAIGAALRGEAEPIRQYGVLLDDATLRQEALRLGLIKTTKEALTPQQRVLAAQAAIYKQTKDAQGDFQRTSGGLANQQRILAATFKDTQAELGTKLLPYAVKATTAVNNFVKGAQNGTGAGGAFADAVGDVGDVLKPVAGLVVATARGFNDLPGPVKSTAVAAAILAFAIKKTGFSFTVASAQVRQFGASMTYATERQALASRATTALSGAARNAAGAGGLLLLASAFTDTGNKAQSGVTQIDNATKSLGKSVVGATAAGAAMAGPVGALVGFTGGAATGIYRLNRAFDELPKVSTGFVAGVGQARKSLGDLRSTLDQTTGAATRLTKQRIAGNLIDNGAAAGARRLGITLHDLVEASVGNEKAANRVRVAYQKALNQPGGTLTDKLGNAGQIKQIQKVVNDLGLNYANASEKVKRVADRQREINAAVKGGNDALKSRPKTAATTVTAPGLKQTQSGFSSLYGGIAKRPKNGNVPVAAPGAKGAQKAIDDVTSAAKTAGKQHPKPSVDANTKPFFSGLGSALSAAKRSSATVPVRADLSGFYAAVRTAKAGVAAGGAVGVAVTGKPRAKGGPIAAGRPYVVGEVGPELVVPNRSGYVIPNDKTMAMARNIAAVPVASTAGGGGPVPLHVYDVNNVLIGTMMATADQAYFSNAALATQGR